MPGISSVLATVAVDGALRFLHARSGRVLCRWIVHRGRGLHVSADRNRLLTCGIDQHLRQWFEEEEERKKERKRGG
jgi:hypothetical protein